MYGTRNVLSHTLKISVRKDFVEHLHCLLFICYFATYLCGEKTVEQGEVTNFGKCGSYKLKETTHKSAYSYKLWEKIEREYGKTIIEIKYRL